LLIQLLVIHCLEKRTIPFEKEKSKIEERMNSMRLGNYLRRLMLKNNDLLDNEFVFLDHSDFLLGNDDLNYSNLQLKDNDDEFRARIFAFKWAKENNSKSKLKPFSVAPGEEVIAQNWKNYLVLLMGDNGENQLAKVCFPNAVEDNFAIVTDMNKNCQTKINKIQEFKIIEDDQTVGSTPKKEIEKKKEKTHHKDKKIEKTIKKTKNDLKHLERKKKYDQIIKNLAKDEDLKSKTKKQPTKPKRKEHLKKEKHEKTNHNKEKIKEEEKVSAKPTNLKSNKEEKNEEPTRQIKPSLNLPSKVLQDEDHLHRLAEANPQRKSLQSTPSSSSAPPRQSSGEQNSALEIEDINLMNKN